MARQGRMFLPGGKLRCVVHQDRPCCEPSHCDEALLPHASGMRELRPVPAFESALSCRSAAEIFGRLTRDRTFDVARTDIGTGGTVKYLKRQ